MDYLMQVIGGIIGIVVSFAGLFAGIGYFKQGRRKEELDTIVLMEKKIEALEGKINEQDIKIDELQKTIEDLHKDNLEKNNKLSELMSILQGRNPQMDEVIVMMKAYITANVPLLETIKTKTIPAIERIEKSSERWERFLDKQSF